MLKIYRLSYASIKLPNRLFCGLICLKIPNEVERATWDGIEIIKELSVKGCVIATIATFDYSQNLLLGLTHTYMDTLTRVSLFPVPKWFGPI